MKAKMGIIILFLGLNSWAQVGIGTNTPNASSILDITSSNKGILVPRVSITNIALQAPIGGTASIGLLVWNTNTTTIGGKGVGFYYWDGLKWVYLINTNTIATYVTPHNTLDAAYDEGGAGFGKNITADAGYIHITGDGLRVSGNAGNYLGSTSGSQMFFYPRRAAFRAGSGTWSDNVVVGGGPGAGNIGTYSVAMGFNTNASEIFSLALVNNSSAEAESAVAIGNGARAVQQDDMALGQSAIANGLSAIAIGESSEATGKSSIAIGSAAHAIGMQSTALGKSCQAEALNSTALGFGAQAISDESLAIGASVRTDSFREFSLGSYNTNGAGNLTAWVTTDRLLSIGNGMDNLNRSNAMVILKNGNIGIGFDAPTEKLEVNGNVKATKFITPINTYPDYVFENYFNGYTNLKKDYKMLSLEEAEKYVKKEGHLYGVKSYAKIKESGMQVDLTETSTKNLEKIEELFLYIIELKKQNETLQKKIEILMQREK